MPSDLGPVLKPAPSARRTEAGTADGSNVRRRRWDPDNSEARAAVRPEVIQVDFTTGKSRGFGPRPQRIPAKPARGLAVTWLVNVLAAAVTLLWALSKGDLAATLAPIPSAVPFFLIGALTGLAADGSARLVALSPFRRGIHKVALNNELLTGAAMVFLVVSVIFAILGCLAALKGLV